ncbi:MAG TPA: protein-L-isoaspartate(D-aspartate) O-methyltransferase [Geminicoccaceae bacterium]
MQPGTAAAAAERMVESQIAARGVKDPRVLAAMREVPREAFVPEAQRAAAHDDGPLPIGAGQTISQPYVVALMAEAAEIAPGDRVLDVGTGSGYAAAVLSRLAARVCSIERHASLAEAARERLAGLGYANIEVRVGDGTLGWPDQPDQPDRGFDAILVAAAAPAVPEALKRQLAVGGRLVIPVGGKYGQGLLRLRLTAVDRWEEENLGEVAFVPLVGRQGWPADGDGPPG